MIRTYTPRRVDRGAHRLVVDFALHPDGATAWAAEARPGDAAVVTGAGYRCDRPCPVNAAPRRREVAGLNFPL